MKDKVELAVFVIGNVHSDFTLAPALKQIFKLLHQQKIPFTFLEEGPSDQDLKMAKQSTMNGIKQTQIFKQLAPEILTYYSKEHNAPSYLKGEAWEPIYNIIRNKIAPLLNIDQNNTGLITQLTLEVFRENAYKEEINLYDTLIALKIPYAGIDAPTAIYNNLMINSSASEENYYQNELTRINTMVQNATNKMKDFSSHGMVFITTGGSHAHRLAANLLREHQTNNTQKYNLNLNVFKLYSSFVKEFNKNYAIKLTSSLDSEDIKEIYKMLPCDDVSSQYSDHGYSIPHLENLINDFISKNMKKGNKHLTTFSIFSPSAHDQLLKDITGLLNTHPLEFRAGIIKTIEKERNYSLALRKFCAQGDLDLIKALIKYDKELPINYNETSSNGNSALVWAETSKVSEEVKNQIKIILEEKLASASNSNKTELV